MLARTHGQPATPTTMGKEIAVFAYRLSRIAAQVEASEYLGKFSGATGTFAAHLAADPSADWRGISREFVERAEGLGRQRHASIIARNGRGGTSVGEVSA
ncbi:lyase family protein [Rhizobium johnstonii]|uniref:lyase family protein n=1 Tax=Rhizobium johnstonii TaxID=3019933 RepID=UPI003F979B4D